jgi:hypothetical protein
MFRNDIDFAHCLRTAFAIFPFVCVIGVMIALA